MSAPNQKIDNHAGPAEYAAAAIISVKAGASSKLVLDLTALDNGDKVSSAGDKYSEIQIVCHTNGEAVARSLGGTWADGGA